jgi:hypothetical protein
MRLQERGSAMQAAYKARPLSCPQTLGQTCHSACNSLMHTLTNDEFPGPHQLQVNCCLFHVSPQHHFIFSSSAILKLMYSLFVLYSRVPLQSS